MNTGRVDDNHHLGADYTSSGGHGGCPSLRLISGHVLAVFLFHRIALVLQLLAEGITWVIVFPFTIACVVSFFRGCWRIRLSHSHPESFPEHGFCRYRIRVIPRPLKSTRGKLAHPGSRSVRNRG